MYVVPGTQHAECEAKPDRKVGGHEFVAPWPNRERKVGNQEPNRPVEQWARSR